MACSIKSVKTDIGPGGYCSPSNYMLEREIYCYMFLFFQIRSYILTFIRPSDNIKIYRPGYD